MISDHNMNIHDNILVDRYHEKYFNRFSGIPKLIYIPERLGLVIYNVLIEVDSNNMDYAEIALRKHPYVLNIFRYFKTNHGIFAKFNIPNKTLYILVKYLEMLRKLKIFNDYKIFMGSGIHANIQPKINANYGNYLDFTQWFELIDRVELLNPCREYIEKELKQFKIQHFEILKYLSIEPTITIDGLSKQIQGNKEELLKAYYYITANIIYSVKERQNEFMNKLNNKSIYLITINNLSKKEAYMLYNLITQYPLPFDITVEITHDNSIFFYCDIGFNEMMNFSKSIWNRYPQSEFYILDNEMGKSTKNWFKSENFNFKNKKWKTSYNFMIEKPINQFLQHKLHWECFELLYK